MVEYYTYNFRHETFMNSVYAHNKNNNVEQKFIHSCYLLSCNYFRKSSHWVGMGGGDKCPSLFRDKDRTINHEDLKAVVTAIWCRAKSPFWLNNDHCQTSRVNIIWLCGFLLVLHVGRVSQVHLRQYNRVPQEQDLMH